MGQRREEGKAEDPISQVKDVSRDVSKWRASSLGNPGIKDLGHVLRGIPKLSAKRGENGRHRRVDRRERGTIIAPNRVPLLREASKVIVVTDLVFGRRKRFRS